MGNLFDYVLKYGDISFEDKEFNEIDNLVFSLVSYLDFTFTGVNRYVLTLKEVIDEYLGLYSYDDIKKIGEAQRDAYKLIKIIINKKRYKDVIASDYVYIVSSETQFSACTFKIKNNLNYICFEGTDEVVSGWKEDGRLACFFPVPAQKYAIDYVNKNVKVFGSRVIVGGHSKGGHLALISSMYIKGYKRFKIKKIYSNDGPGLRREEFNSQNYKKIKDRYIHIVPEYSIIGLLLKSEKHKVIKSTKSSIFSHSMSTWIVEDDKLLMGNLSLKSKQFEKNVSYWLDNHSSDEIEKMIKSLFKVFEDAQITHLTNVTKIKNILKILRNIGHIDKESKKLIIDLLFYSFLSHDELPLDKEIDDIFSKEVDS